MFDEEDDFVSSSEDNLDKEVHDKLQEHHISNKLNENDIEDLEKLLKEYQRKEQNAVDFLKSIKISNNCLFSIISIIEKHLND